MGGGGAYAYGCAEGADPAVLKISKVLLYEISTTMRFLLL